MASLLEVLVWLLLLLLCCVVALCRAVRVCPEMKRVNMSRASRGLVSGTIWPEAHRADTGRGGGAPGGGGAQAAAAARNTAGV